MWTGTGSGWGIETGWCLGCTTTGECGTSMLRGTGSGSGIGKIPFLGVAYLRRRPAPINPLKMVFLLTFLASAQLWSNVVAIKIAITILAKDFEFILVSEKKSKWKLCSD